MAHKSPVHYRVPFKEPQENNSLGYCSKYVREFFITEIFYSVGQGISIGS